MKNFDLDDACAKQVERDNDTFGIESVYLPNPVLTKEPKFCLISSEPSMGNFSPVDFRTKVANGFRNFLNYEGDLILHFCAYRFLCDQSFKYYLTDISKGAMKTETAKRNRDERFMAWKEILERGLLLFGSPILISVGRKAQKFVEDNRFDAAHHVRHFAKNCDDYFTGYFDYYREHCDTTDTDNLLTSFQQFLRKLIDRLEPTCSNIAILERFVDAPNISDACVGRFLYYRDEFRNVKCIVANGEQH